MKMGFTGTQKGMTPLQIKAVYLILWEYRPQEVHHGDCIGADEEFHNLAKEVGMRVVIHPPIKDEKRAFCVGDESRPEQHYLIRNHFIVDETEVLIATPKSNKEELRSGTWATIRYAFHKEGKEVRIVWPNGNISVWREGGKKEN
jgi:hypothetical protein